MPEWFGLIREDKYAGLPPHESSKPQRKLRAVGWIVS